MSGRLIGLTLALAAALITACDSRGAGRSDLGGSTVVLGDARPLTPLFAALLELEAGDRTQPVTIIQLGDSHTANGRFSARLRDLFQERFGAAGRGMLPPGVPFDYYRPSLVTVEQSEGWVVANSFSSEATGLFGLSGFRAEARSDEDFMSLESQEPDGFDRAQLLVLRQPGGGSLAIEVDGRKIQDVATAGTQVQAARLDLDIPRNSRRLTLRPAGDGPVDLLAWATERDRPGVLLDNHGISGATINVLSELESATVAWELANRAPALIIVAFGTNEGFDDGVARQAYATAFSAQLQALHRAVPGSAILVIGPPDGNRLPRGCRDARNPDRQFSCAPLTTAERAVYTERFRGEETPDAYCRWHTPPNLDTVRDTQRQVAEGAGYYFWDWSEVMGGDCGMHNWTTAVPEPLGARDHVHLSGAGYADSAEALFQELMAYYALFRAANGETTAELPLR